MRKGFGVVFICVLWGCWLFIWGWKRRRTEKPKNWNKKLILASWSAEKIIFGPSNCDFWFCAISSFVQNFEQNYKFEIYEKSKIAVERPKNNFFSTSICHNHFFVSIFLNLRYQEQEHNPMDKYRIGHNPVHPGRRKLQQQVLLFIFWENKKNIFLRLFF